MHVQPRLVRQACYGSAGSAAPCRVRIFLRAGRQLAYRRGSACYGGSAAAPHIRLASLDSGIERRCVSPSRVSPAGEQLSTLSAPLLPRVSPQQRAAGPARPCPTRRLQPAPRPEPLASPRLRLGGG